MMLLMMGCVDGDCCQRLWPMVLIMAEVGMMDRMNDCCHSL